MVQLTWNSVFLLCPVRQKNWFSVSYIQNQGWKFKRIFLRKLIQLLLIFRQFILSHVVVVEPLKQENKDIQVKVFVALPDGKDIRENDYVAIAGSVLKEILVAYKQNLSSAVGAELKSINTESDSSDNTMNYIMIPITFALLVVLCCVAFCLHSARYQRIFTHSTYLTFPLLPFRHSFGSSRSLLWKRNARRSLKNVCMGGYLNLNLEKEPTCLDYWFLHQKSFKRTRSRLPVRNT